MLLLCVVSRLKWQVSSRNFHKLAEAPATLIHGTYRRLRESITQQLSLHPLDKVQIILKYSVQNHMFCRYIKVTLMLRCSRPRHGLSSGRRQHVHLMSEVQRWRGDIQVLCHVDGAGLLRASWQWL